MSLWRDCRSLGEMMIKRLAREMTSDLLRGIPAGENINALTERRDNAHRQAQLCLFRGIFKF